MPEGVISRVIKGSCLCGKVAYELRGLPQATYYCHCGMCRKATGSSFATNMLARSDEFLIVAGRPYLKSYESSPNEYRHFCSECGSPIYGEAAARPNIVSIRCGTLGGDPGVRPSSHIYTASKSPWFAISDQLSQFPEDPE
jgi:hypothetical protein